MNSAPPRMKTWHVYRAAIWIALLQLLLPANLGLALPNQQTAPDDAYTGVELLRQCKDAIREGDPGYPPTPSGTMCIGYLTGFVAGSIVTGNFYQSQSRSLHPAICFPKSGITGDQEILIVVKWLTDHPQLLHLNEGILVEAAFQDAFPCK
jgi:hypothetical protein